MFMVIYFLFIFYSSSILSNEDKLMSLSVNWQNLSMSAKEKIKLIGNDENFSEYQIGCVKIRLQKANMLEFKADAIVNAANEACLSGGGVDGQIVARGGKLLADARKKLPLVSKGVRCPTGQARLTIAGELPFRYILHAVAPMCGSNEDYDVLTQTYTNTIKRAAAFNKLIKEKKTENKEFPEFKNIKDKFIITSISFPTLGTGIFGCDTQKGAEKIIPAVLEYFKTNCDTSIEQIIFTFYNPPDPKKANQDFAIYKQIFDKLT